MTKDQIEWIMHQSPCEIKGCSGHSNSNFGAVRLKGTDKEFTVCNRCFKEIFICLAMNEGT